MFVGIVVFGRTVHLAEDTLNQDARILPLVSCRKTQRSPLGHPAAANDVSLRIVGVKCRVPLDDVWIIGGECLKMISLCGPLVDQFSMYLDLRTASVPLTAPAIIAANKRLAKTTLVHIFLRLENLDLGSAGISSLSGTSSSMPS